MSRLIAQLLASLLLVALLAAPAPALKADVPRVFHAPFGTGDGQVGGAKQDSVRVGEGFPPAFAEAADGRLLILDLINGRVLRYDLRAGTTEIAHRIKKNGNVPDAVYDIAPTTDGGFWLASRGRKELRRVDARGKVTMVVEGVFPQAVMCAGGFLLVSELRRGSIMRFSANGRMTGFVEEGGTLPPVSRTGEEVYTALFEREAGQIYRHQFDSGERVELSAVRPPEKGQYIQSLATLGFDRAGRLYVEAAFARDLDPGRTRHEYRLFILRIDPATGRELGRLEVEPFRSVNSLLSPRQYAVTADGALLTYEVENGGFSLCRYNFPPPPAPKPR